MTPDSPLIISNILHKAKTAGIFSPADKIVVGVSGGSDSTALLVALTEISLSMDLIAVYVDHGLRPGETENEIKFVSSLCSQLGVQFLVKKVDVRAYATREKRSIEESARHLRYQALEEVRRKYDYDKIGVGHNLDDQVEEFFIRLLRGSSVRGLSGMRLQRDRIIRPLLGATRSDLQKYLIDKNISWCTDSSNSDRIFLRNRIRLDLLPELEKNYNPSLRRTVLQNMAILREEDDLISGLAETAFKDCIAKDDNNSHGKSELIVELARFGDQHKAIRNRIIEKCCWQMGVRPSFTTITDIVNLAATGENGKELHLPQRLRVIKTRDKLVFTQLAKTRNARASVSASTDYLIHITEPGSFTVPQTEITVEISLCYSSSSMNFPVNSLVADMDKCPFPLVLRGVTAGAKFDPSRGIGRRKVARYYNDKKLDKHKRATWPVIYHNKQVVAIAGYDIDRRYMADENTEKILVIRIL